MNTRGKRLVSMIIKEPPQPTELDQEPCCSSSVSSSILTESQERIAAEMERIFDSDDSDKDPTFYPYDDHDLIQPEDLLGEAASSKPVEDNQYMNYMRNFNEDDVDLLGNVVKPVDPDGRQIVKDILDSILDRVHVSTRPRRRWMQADPASWKRNMAKKRRSDGLPYTLRKKTYKPKVPGDIDCTKCFFKCNVIKKDEREVLCRHYWNLSFIEKKNFLLSNITVESPKTVRATRGPKKQRTFSKKCYFIHEGVKKQVCQKFFCSTLSISYSIINDAIKKRNDNGLYSNQDKRGKHAPVNKTSTASVNFVKKHIESFPTMAPHYIRKTSKRLYLDASLSIRKMYQLYKEKCNEENVTPVSEITYRRIFSRDYNLSFFVPKKDQCLICTNYLKSTGEGREAMKQSYDDHISRKKTCSNEKQKDKLRASNEKNFCCVSFDLQAVLQIPSGLVGQLYYCRKLCVYNLCIYEAALPNDGYCYTWSEVNGKRGSSEIGSILYHYLSKVLPTNVSEVCLYSDTCGGQNRNQFVASLLLFAVKNINNLNIIEHKFLESGHSYMEADSMHSSIESAKKNAEIYSMLDYVSLFKRARAPKRIINEGVSYDRRPYTVKELKYDEFFDLKSLAEDTIKNKSIDNNGNQVKWLKIKRMRYDKSEPSKIFFNYDMSQELLYIDVSLDPNPPRTVKTRKTIQCKNKEQEVNIGTIGSERQQLKQLYYRPLPITEAKKKDLEGLCKKKIIPEELHGWFSNLPTSNTTSDKLPEPDKDEDSSEE